MLSWWRDWWRSLNTFERTAAVLIGAVAVAVLIVTGVAAEVAATAPPATDNTIPLALIVAGPTFVAVFVPIAVGWIKARGDRQQRLDDAKIRAEEREETRKEQREIKLLDLKRQDDVAARAAEVARALVENSGVTNTKLDVIHTLVNSNLTAAKESELSAIQRELVMMNEVISIKRATGHEPSVEALSAIKVTEARIADLKQELVERAEATAKADAQTTAAKAVARGIQQTTVGLLANTQAVKDNTEAVKDNTDGKEGK